LRLFTVACVAAVLAVSALFGLLVHRTITAQKFREQTSSNCAAIESLKDALRATLMEGEARALARPELDAAQRAAIQASYDREINRYAPVKCPTP
jgi:translation initiation factor 6 (eIF-6)